MNSFRTTWQFPFILLTIPPVLWAVYALANGYVLEGDNAQIAIRVHDVFSSNPPLLGMPSTAGLEAAHLNVFHLGPLHFLLLAPFYALSGYSVWGMVVGALAVNMGLVAIAFWVAWRIGLPWAKNATVTAFVLVMLPIQFMAFSPWNPYPFYFGAVTLTILLWAIVIGVPRLLVPTVAVASLLAQVHIVGAVLVAASIVFACGVALKYRWAQRSSSGEIGIAGIIFVLCWALPAWEMLTRWPGNIGQLLSYISVTQNSASDESQPGFLFPVPVAIGLLVFLWLVAVLGILRSTRTLSGHKNETYISDTQIMAMGLLVASLVVLSAALLGTFADTSRTEYLIFYFGVIAFIFLLRRQSAQQWWQTWTGLTAKILTLFVVGSIGFGYLAIPGIHESAQSREVIGATRELLAEFHNSPVIVESSGPTVDVSTAIGVVADLVTNGHEVYYEHFGGRDDYDTWRRIDQAPAKSLVLQLLERDEKGKPPEIERKVISKKEVFLADAKSYVWIVLSAQD